MGGSSIPDSTLAGAAAPAIPVTHRNYPYRLKLRPSQHRAFERILEQQRLLFNAALQARIEAWSKAKISRSYIAQTQDLTQIRADDPDGYGALPVALCRGTLKRLDLAFQAFFRRVKSGDTPGFPRFKPMSRWDSFSLTEMSGLVLKGAGARRGALLQLKGVPGLIRVRQHRPLPAGVSPKSAIFRRGPGGWTVSLCGATVMKALTERLHACSCGLTINRDINAARNILQRALREDKIPARRSSGLGDNSVTLSARA